MTQNRTKVINQCKWCGELYMAVKYEISRGKGKYCSNRCKGMAGNVALKKQMRRMVESSDEKKKAHRIFVSSIRTGKVKRPNSCQHCGRSGCPIDGHHEDYSKPNDVIWLCKSCHQRVHYGTLAVA